MDANKKEKLITLYYKILRREYSISKNALIDEILYNLLLELENKISSGAEGTLFMDEDSYDEIRVEYLSKLLVLFPRVESNNLQDKVLDACKLFVHLRGYRSYIPDALELYFFPQESYLNNKNFYYSLWDEIIRNYTEDTSLDMDYKYIKAIDPKITNLLDTYISFGEGIEIDINNWRNNTLFNKYIKIVIPYFYKEGYDTELFPKVLDYAFNHALEIEEYYTMNTGSKNEYVSCSKLYEMDEGIINVIMNGAMGNNRIIR